MGEPHYPRNPAFPLSSSALGDLLIGLYETECPASKEFLYMGREFKAFHASYQTVRPFLQPSAYFITPACRDLIQNIYTGAGILCDEITERVNTFTRRLNRETLNHQSRSAPLFLFHRGRYTTQARNERFRDFFGGGRYDLERCQLSYGTSLLNLILAVFVYTQRDVQDWIRFSASDTLVADLHIALDELRSRERRQTRRRRRLLIEASYWYDPLPDPPSNSEATPPLAALSGIWVNAEARLAAQPSAHILGFQHIIQQWREQNEQFRTQIQQLDQGNSRLQTENVQLRNDNIQLEDENQDLRDRIYQLEGKIRQLMASLDTGQYERGQQGNHTDYYRQQHDRVYRQSNIPFGERERADERVRRAQPRHDDPIHNVGSQRRERSMRSRGHNPQDRVAPEIPSRSSQPRSSSFTNSGPPVTFETQGHRRHRSSSNQSTSSREGWNSSTTAGASSGRCSYRNDPPFAPPPINPHTRPFRTGP